ncbi:MAG: hypothetical protein Q7O66_19290, partial [Dehalococcoidia bacterium]|nr:hypothetical protein [Dehalococcoidia bacterium]
MGIHDLDNRTCKGYDDYTEPIQSVDCGSADVVDTSVYNNTHRHAADRRTLVPITPIIGSKKGPDS